MRKISILILLLSISSLSAFAASSANYTTAQDTFIASGSVGLSSANYRINDVLGKTTGVDFSSGSRYDIGGGSNDLNDSTVWYLAEGCTNGFDTYILIQNPNSETAEVRITFMDQDANTVVVNQDIGATQRYTIHVNQVSGMENRDVSTTIVSTNEIPVRAERAMYWNSGDLNWIGGHDSIGITSPSTSWYLAEGCTNGFDEYVLLQNPNSTAATIELTFMDPDGNTALVPVTLAGQSRYTIHVNNVAGMEDRDVSAAISSDIPINVERSMYWDSGEYSWAGGHVSIGVTSPATTWYLAEGCTNGFDEYVLLQNPNTATATINVTFMDQDGNTALVPVTLGGQKRFTIHVNNVAGMDNCDVSATVTSDQPVITERAMYWDSAELAWAGGHDSIGVTSAGTTWYLAEGCTRDFDEYVLFQNPGGQTANVTANFMDQNGDTSEVTFVLEGQKRYTIHVNNVSNMNDRDVSVTVTSDVAINVERAMYWNSGDYSWIGGHDSCGIRQ